MFGILACAAAWTSWVQLCLCTAEGLERRAQFCAEQLRLLPRGEVAALVDPVEVDELVVRPLGPAPRRLEALAGEDGDGSRDRDVGGEVEVHLVLPIKPCR